jgi:hypothetical protein
MEALRIKERKVSKISPTKWLQDYPRETLIKAYCSSIWTPFKISKIGTRIINKWFSKPTLQMAFLSLLTNRLSPGQAESLLIENSIKNPKFSRLIYSLNKWVMRLQYQRQWYLLINIWKIIVIQIIQYSHPTMKAAWSIKMAQIPNLNLAQ